MKIAVSSDEYSPLTKFVLENLENRGYKTEYFGPMGKEEADWPDVTHKAVLQVVEKKVDEAIVMCWTGTGACMAANKVKGIRAALCGDAETAKGARIWNHANTLVLSIRATSLPIAKEILDSWFSTPFSQDEWNLKQIAKIQKMDELLL
ncbi:MAG: RpiB/LacA/LacB family sugar-phosphate isomerase [Leptospiraceae bacterium]|nr:RpiB/LacA/LacB family sugar-phosphate isomerase [Leptospiraceae bacterium]MCP5492960.1 RpiB/LacA/LacB family sugar-phosphate isomerase [Leptospiraceae bacterium]